MDKWSCIAKGVNWFKIKHHTTLSKRVIIMSTPPSSLPSFSRIAPSHDRPDLSAYDNGDFKQQALTINYYENLNKMLYTPTYFVKTVPKTSRLRGLKETRYSHCGRTVISSVNPHATAAKRVIVMSSLTSSSSIPLDYVPDHLKTNELCQSVVEQDGMDVELVSDVMREINTFLTDNDDQLHLAQVSEAWRHALKDNTDAIWTQEWDTFKYNNGHEPWFTEIVYTIPLKQSKFNGMFNAFRKLATKEAKEYQSLRQRMTEQLTIVDDPSPIELLIVNGKRKMTAMSKKELDEIMENRPSFRMMLAKTGCIIAAPVLIALGTALIPLSIVTCGGLLALSKIRKTGGGGPMGGGGMAGLMLAAAPTSFPWMGAGMALTVVVDESNLRKIPQLYKSLREYREKNKEIE